MEKKFILITDNFEQLLSQPTIFTKNEINNLSQIELEEINKKSFFKSLYYNDKIIKIKPIVIIGILKNKKDIIIKNNLDKLAEIIENSNQNLIETTEFSNSKTIKNFNFKSQKIKLLNKNNKFIELDIDFFNFITYY